MKGLLAFDMDGTILKDHVSAHDETIIALKEARKNGWKLAIATGRPLIDSKRPFLDDLKIFDYYICNNGTYRWEAATDEFTFDKTISREIVKYIAELATKYNSFFALHTKSNVYRVMTNKDIDINSPEFEEMKNFKLYEMEEVLKKNEIAMQASIRTTKENAIKIVKEFTKYDDKVSVTIANEVYVDFNPKGISKFTGVEDLALSLDIEVKDVIAFGDSGNDVDMLKNVGYGIAMGNATEDAKKVAKEVIGNNDTTALAEKIMEIIRS